MNEGWKEGTDTVIGIGFKIGCVTNLFLLYDCTQQTLLPATACGGNKSNGPSVAIPVRNPAQRNWIFANPSRHAGFLCIISDNNARLGSPSPSHEVGVGNFSPTVVLMI